MIESSKYTFKAGLFPGLLLLLPLSAGLVAITVVLFLFFSRQQPGPLFFLTFILSVALLIPIGFISYRTYALIASEYTLVRNALRIKWGLRQETIPLSEIDWVRTPAEMKNEVPWPFLPMPGAYTGKVKNTTGEQLEFMASSVKNMLFIGTSREIYGISPSDPQRFLTAFERVLQMGTLTEVEHETIRPADWVASSWDNRTGRVSFFLSIAMLIILSLWIGFRLSGGVVNSPLVPENASGSFSQRNILLLPTMAAGLWFFNLIVGIRVYRMPALQKIAELVWGSSPIVIFLFLVAGFLMI